MHARAAALWYASLRRNSITVRAGSAGLSATLRRPGTLRDRLQQDGDERAVAHDSTSALIVLASTATFGASARSCMY